MSLTPSLLWVAFSAKVCRPKWSIFWKVNGWNKILKVCLLFELFEISRTISCSTVLNLTFLRSTVPMYWIYFVDCFALLITTEDQFCNQPIHRWWCCFLIIGEEVGGYWRVEGGWLNQNEPNKGLKSITFDCWGVLRAHRGPSRLPAWNPTID